MQTGISQRFAGQLEEALQSFTTALDLNAKIHGEIHPSIVSCCDWLRLVCLQLGKPFDAEKYGIRRNKVQVELDKLGIAAGADRVVDY